MDASSLTTHLKTEGFRPSFFGGTNRLAYEGILDLCDLKIPIKLVFHSQHPTDFPEAYIGGWNNNYPLQQQLGIVNISKEGKLCYIDPVHFWWDSSKLPNFTQTAINRIKQILTDKIQGDVEEEQFIRDFGAYWDGESVYSKVPLTIYGDYRLRIVEKSRWLECDKTNSKSPFFCVQARDFPIPTDYTAWPPSTLSDFLDWLRCDPSSYKAWINELVSKVATLSKGKKCNKPLTVGSIIIPDISPDPQVPPPTIAVLFSINVPLRNALLGRRTKHITTLSKNSEISRYEIKRADPFFIYGRNMPQGRSLLINRKITVIGAGAIGGFLCSQLACLGAGSGHGELHVIDHDMLKPENIGRHFLGMEHVDTHKSKSIQSVLSKSHPDLNIQSTPNQFEKSLDQLNGDLIINATGMQTVGVSLEEIFNTKDAPPILHAWIEGQGAGARTLLNDRKGFACFRCLWNPTSDGIYEPTISLLLPDSPIDATPAGCHHSYFAYPVMAAVKAATLAADAVIDFFNGTPTPRLRNLVIRKDQCLNPDDQNEPKQSDSCQICH